MLTRREFSTLALSALAWPKLLAQTANTVGGVTLGAQTYSFRQLDRPAGGDMTDVLVKAFTECGLRDCELWSPMLEPAATPPAKVAREDLRKWRLETPLDHFTAIRKKFNSANIAIRAYNYSFNDSFTEPEIDRVAELEGAAQDEGLRGDRESHEARQGRDVDGGAEPETGDPDANHAQTGSERTSGSGRTANSVSHQTSI